ncbi:MAG: hypothetical protein ACKV0T_24950 [Planctomycetales bacterium]
MRLLLAAPAGKFPASGFAGMGSLRGALDGPPAASRRVEIDSDSTVPLAALVVAP